MQSLLVNLHSLWRWAVLIVLTVALVRGVVGWLRGGCWSGGDRTLLLVAVNVLNVQIVLGVLLWLVGGYWNAGAFLGIVHPLVMLLALGVAHAGSARIKRTSDPVAKYRTLAISFFAALFLITAVIPPDAWGRIWRG